MTKIKIPNPKSESGSGPSVVNDEKRARGIETDLTS